MTKLLRLGLLFVTFEKSTELAIFTPDMPTAIAVEDASQVGVSLRSADADGVAFIRRGGVANVDVIAACVDVISGTGARYRYSNCPVTRSSAFEPTAVLPLPVVVGTIVWNPIAVLSAASGEIGGLQRLLPPHLWIR